MAENSPEMMNEINSQIREDWRETEEQIKINPNADTSQ